MALLVAAVLLGLVVWLMVVKTAHEMFVGTDKYDEVMHQWLAHVSLFFSCLGLGWVIFRLMGIHL